MQPVQAKFFALGSDAVLTLVASQPSTVSVLMPKLKALILAFEARFSRFAETSELTNVNQSAGQTVEVSPEFADLLAEAIKWARRSGGIFNPLILPALQTAGYAGSWPQPSKSNLATDYTSRRMSTPDRIKLDGNKVQIPSDSALDFGGIGKGYLLDQLALLTKKEAPDLPGFWYSLGGDIIAGGLDPQTKPWSIGLANAEDPSGIAGRFVAPDGAGLFAVATSGITKRRGTDQDGHTWHHLIDPRTGRPSDTDLLSVSVQTASATAADVLAKCAAVLGSTDARRFLESHGVMHALLQLSDPDRSVILLDNGE